MGALFGGYLSAHNDVWLVDVNAGRVDEINRGGVKIYEGEQSAVYHPQALTDASGLGPVDLVLVFVKAMFTEAALAANKGLIGPETYLMTLQNGMGHEQKLLCHAPAERVIIGTTQHNSSLQADGSVLHGGAGDTAIGLLAGNSGSLAPISESFASCGFATYTSDAVKEKIWKKLFLNTAASSLTAVLQVPLGFILGDASARSLMHRLVREAVAVANAEGAAAFDEQTEIDVIEGVLANARGGYTSIYADVKRGARTEVDTISGAVVDAAKRLNVSVPCHETIVALIHALEQKNSSN